MTKDLFDLELELNECFNRISKDFNQIINLVKEELIETVKIAVKESQNQNQFMNSDLNPNRNRRKYKHQSFENIPGAKVIRTEILGTKSVINEIYKDLSSKSNIIPTEKINFNGNINLDEELTESQDKRKDQFVSLIDEIDFSKFNDLKESNIDSNLSNQEQETTKKELDIEMTNCENENPDVKIENQSANISPEIIISELRKLTTDHPKVEFDRFKFNFKLKLTEETVNKYKISRQFKDNFELLEKHIIIYVFLLNRVLEYIQVKDTERVINNISIQIKSLAHPELLFPVMGLQHFIRDILNIEITSNNISEFMKIFHSISAFKVIKKSKRPHKYDILLNDIHSHIIDGMEFNKLTTSGFIYPVRKYSQFGDRTELLLNAYGVKRFYQYFLETQYWNNYFKKGMSKLEDNDRYMNFSACGSTKIDLKEINPYLAEYVKIDEINVPNSIMFYINHNTQ